MVQEAVGVRDTVRLFLGIPVPGRYEAVAAELALLPGARAVPAGGYHVTLRFLGEVHNRDALLAAVGSALRKRPALPFVAESLGSFPKPKQARILWAGVRAPGIEALASAVAQATAKFGEPAEARGFIAHVTMTRLTRPQDVRSLLHAHRDSSFGSGTLDRVVLFDSVQGLHGPRYEPLHEWRLGTS